MKIVITNSAKVSLRILYYFYSETVSKNLAERIKSELIATMSILEDYPNIGQKEERLADLNLNHRYLVNGNHKIIYRVEGEMIYITDFFDTRQDPSKIKG